MKAEILVPKWLENDYFRAIRELAEIGSAEVLDATTIPPPNT